MGVATPDEHGVRTKPEYWRGGQGDTRHPARAVPAQAHLLSDRPATGGRRSRSACGHPAAGQGGAGLPSP